MSEDKVIRATVRAVHISDVGRRAQTAFEMALYNTLRVAQTLEEPGCVRVGCLTELETWVYDRTRELAASAIAGVQALHTINSQRLKDSLVSLATRTRPDGDMADQAVHDELLKLIGNAAIDGLLS